MRLRVVVWLAVLAVSVCACGGKGSIPPLGLVNVSSTTIADRSSQTCSVSYDGLIWYAIPSGSFPPILHRHASCEGALSLGATPPVPSWARPSGVTHAIFTAASLQETYVAGGMQSLEAVASAYHIPVTWMVGSTPYFLQGALYDAYHAANGDDVQVERNPALLTAARQQFPWYAGGVSVQGAGHERDIPGASALGERAFWGIAWNSTKIDWTADYGAPWGSYCADVTSYKRPAPDGSCDMLALEWTARDLTRAYFSGHEEYFSTDPDDLQRRGGFTVTGARGYIDRLVDAYAAAGETQPLIVVSQQESAEEQRPGDAAIMSELYAHAVADGMKIATLAQAAADGRAFSSQPRAVAFPFLTGGRNVASRLLSGSTVYPATIDYHDAASGMTFASGETVPRRVFRYADDPVSLFNVPLPVVPASQLPTLTNVAASGERITFHFEAPTALHYGVALWTDPSKLGLSGPGVVPAGRAGVVLVFDLQSGANDVSFACNGCSGTTFPYSM